MGWDVPWCNLLDSVCAFNGKRADWWFELNDEGLWTSSVFIYPSHYFGRGGTPAGQSQWGYRTAREAQEDAVVNAFISLGMW